MIVGFEHDYDKMGNPDYEVRVHQSDEGDEYTYDGLYRLTRTVYDDSTPTTPAASPATTTTDDFLYRCLCHLFSGRSPVLDAS